MNGDKITQLRNIVQRCQHDKVDGVTVDLFSASAVLKVYDNLSPENQTKYIGLPIHTMADMAFKLLK